MRRKDREMDEAFGRKVIDTAPYGTLALWDEKHQETYSIPLSPVRIGNTLYIHSAKLGRKIDLLSPGKKVHFSFVSYVQPPKNIEKETLEEMKEGALLRKVFTTYYSSACALTICREVDDEEEKKLALEKISEKYTPAFMDYFEDAYQTGAPRVKVYAFDILSLTAKQKKGPF